MSKIHTMFLHFCIGLICSRPTRAIGLEMYFHFFNTNHTFPCESHNTNLCTFANMLSHATLSFKVSFEKQKTLWKCRISQTGFRTEITGTRSHPLMRLYWNLGYWLADVALMAFQWSELLDLLFNLLARHAWCERCGNLNCFMHMNKNKQTPTIGNESLK